MSSSIIPVECFDLIVFGGTGDSARRKLLPALYHRDHDDQMAKDALRGSERTAGNVQGGQTGAGFHGNSALSRAESQRHAGAAHADPASGVHQDKGFRVALMTDGRMSGASGKVPAAIDMTPEAADGGALARLRDGHPIRLDADSGRLDVLVEAPIWAQCQPDSSDLSRYATGIGRELFGGFRSTVTPAEQGAASVAFMPSAGGQ